VESHRATAIRSVPCFVLTVSDTRTLDTETSGRAISDLLQANGHAVVERTLVRDEPRDVERVVRVALADERVRAVITTGGTGISARDSTYEAITALFDKRLDGFGELFRMLSFGEIGSAAMMSRATAGVANRKVVFVLPGSEHAVRLAMSRLILPELGHVAHELMR
jgi:molybdopterin adenylyltransferase